jgi:CDP-glycerol glycerophosphotransferase
MVLYRQQREGRILGTPSDKHLDLIAQYSLLFDELQARGHDSWIPVLFERMIEHGTFLLAEGERRLSPQSQQVLFSQLTAAYRQYKPSNLEPPVGLRKMRYRVVEKGGIYRPRHRLLFRFRPRRFMSRVFNETRSRVIEMFGTDPLHIVT